MIFLIFLSLSTSKKQQKANLYITPVQNSSLQKIYTAYKMDSYERRLVLDALRSDKPLYESVIGFRVGSYYFSGRRELADAIDDDNLEVVEVLNPALEEARLTLAERLRYAHLPHQTKKEVVSAAAETRYQESGVPGFVGALKEQLGRANLCLNNGTPHLVAFGDHLLGREKSGYYEPTVRGVYLDVIAKAVGVKDPHSPKKDRY